MATKLVADHRATAKSAADKAEELMNKLVEKKSLNKWEAVIALLNIQVNLLSALVELELQKDEERHVTDIR